MELYVYFKLQVLFLIFFPFFFFFQVLFYTLTKALGQRFDIFSFPHPDLLSPEIIVALQTEFMLQRRIGFTIYYLFLFMCPVLNL